MSQPDHNGSADKPEASHLAPRKVSAISPSAFTFSKGGFCQEIELEARSMQRTGHGARGNGTRSRSKRAKLRPGALAFNALPDDVISRIMCSGFLDSAFVISR
jgi:hypothetical protein